MLSAVSFLAFLGGVSREWIVVRLAEGQSWLTAVCFFAFLAAFAAAVFYAVLGECNRKHTVAFAVFAIAMTIAAQKNMTNGTDGVSSPACGLMSVFNPPEIGGLTDDGDISVVTGVCFGSFAKTGDVVTASIAIGDGSLELWDPVRVYAADNLESPTWTNVYEHFMHHETSLTVRFDMSSFPTSFLAHAFFGLEYPQDSDGDGVEDGDERYRYHSNPAKYDTDDDGLGDGDEIRIGSDPVAADSDGDGLTDAEEFGGALALTGTAALWLDTSSCSELALVPWMRQEWSVPVAGGVTLAGVRYTSFTIGSFGWVAFGDTVFVEACGQSMYADPSWQSRLLYGTVVTNGEEYLVTEYRGISSDETGSAKLSCQIIVPKLRPNVVLVSYRDVGCGIGVPYYPIGVTCNDMVSPFDGQSRYSILPPVGYRIPAEGATIMYTIGMGSDPTKYNRYEEPDLSADSNSNAYYTVDVVADDHAHIVFSGDGPSDLPDPDFWALPGETNRVKLLMGKTYVASAGVSVSCISTSDPEAVVESLSSRSFSVVRPVDVVASAVCGCDFLMQVSPTNLNGVFVWTDSCCPITGCGHEFWYAHAGDCACDGCYATGAYRYEGYSLPCLGGYCDCPSRHRGYPRLQEDDGPYAAAVSVAFSAPAVIFEDAYDNNPTSSVPRRSTQTTLTCVVHGGETGGTASFSIVNASKLDSVDGDLPDPVFVPPMQKLEFDVCYEGNEPSTGEGDIAVTGTFTPRDGGTALTDSDTLTSIRLSMTAIYEAPENPCTNRHVYGVGEKVRFKVTPALQQVGITTRKFDQWDHGYRYELFDEDVVSVDGSSQHVYVCPISASFTPPIKVSYSDVEYMPAIGIIEPQRIITPEFDWASYHAPGVVGQGFLITTNYIGPLSVSFQGILVAEIPCTEVITPIGYFASSNFTGYLSHTSDAQAGIAKRIQSGNRWTMDEAGGGAYPNWSSGRLEWKIPIGWFRVLSDDIQHSNVSAAEYEMSGIETSRLLLIGGQTDKYKQIMTIDEEGNSKVEKFGHWLMRGQDDKIVLDGVRKR